MKQSNITHTFTILLNFYPGVLEQLLFKIMRRKKCNAKFMQIDHVVSISIYNSQNYEFVLKAK